MFIIAESLWPTHALNALGTQDISIKKPTLTNDRVPFRIFGEEGEDQENQESEALFLKNKEEESALSEPKTSVRKPRSSERGPSEEPQRGPSTSSEPLFLPFRQLRSTGLFDIWGPYEPEWGEVNECIVPLRFRHSSILELYNSTRTDCGLFDMSQKQILELKGRDRCVVGDHFLTCNLKKMKIGDVQYACVLDTKAYVLDLAFVLKAEDTIYLLTEGYHPTQMLNYLSSYVTYTKKTGLDCVVKKCSREFGPNSIELCGPNSFRRLAQCGVWSSNVGLNTPSTPTLSNIPQSYMRNLGMSKREDEVFFSEKSPEDVLTRGVREDVYHPRNSQCSEMSMRSPLHGVYHVPKDDDVLRSEEEEKLEILRAQNLAFLEQMPNHSFVTIANGKLILAKGSLSGEKGLMIFGADRELKDLIRKLLKKNKEENYLTYDLLRTSQKTLPPLLPCDYLTYDLLRTEAGHPRMGVDIHAGMQTPIQCSLAWTIDQAKLRTHVLFGYERLFRQLAKGPTYRRVGFEVNGVVHGGCCIFSDVQDGDSGDTKNHDGSRRPIGEITTSVYSPALKTRIAMGYIKPEYARGGNNVLFNVLYDLPVHKLTSKRLRFHLKQGKMRAHFRRLVPGKVVKLPFVEITT